MAKRYASFIHTVCAAIAAPSGIGKLLPLDFARRKIPLKALGLKQYFSRCGPVSKASDKKDTPAALCDRPDESVTVPVKYSGKLRVENSLRHTVPEFIHFREQLPESSPMFARERSRDVFP